MGIPMGVTLIVGGGYHGKSTLLQAIERGVYNHILGDGREWVVTNPTAVKIRAEDGRRIENVDISSFIHNPPMDKNTVEFKTENASGSTSQAANIIESLEAGTELLLFDEDTSATNFMIRDERMQRLVSKDKEPITPFIDRIQEIYSEYNTSTVIVMGGSGDYFEVADTVVMMDNYKPENATEDAIKIKNELPINRKMEVNSKFKFKERYPEAESVKPYKGRKLKLDVRGRHTILLGVESIDLLQVEQLMDTSQTRAIAYAINHAQTYMDGKHSMNDVMGMIERDIDRNGLDVLAPSGRRYPHNLARPRIFEFIAALNRLRTFKTLSK
jgi:predicted ABC-class ATPase